ncbi:hypothetical protein QJS66_04625 [Kocuria rhizophila]|nr:hypothetical protein QJS66_04625 [Kocuria rhizophila]
MTDLLPEDLLARSAPRRGRGPREPLLRQRSWRRCGRSATCACWCRGSRRPGLHAGAGGPPPSDGSRRPPRPRRWGSTCTT